MSKMQANKVDLSREEEIFRFEVEFMHKYLKHFEQSIIHHDKVLKKALLEDIEYAGKHNASILESIYNNDILKIPSLGYNSSLLLIYSLLESTLLKICSELHKQLKLPLELAEIKGGNYFESSLKYLQTFTALNDDLYHLGKDFVPYQKIRNYIAHNGAVIPNGSENAKNKLFASSITYNNDGSFYINNIKFLKAFLSKVEKFIYGCVKLIGQLNITPVKVQVGTIIKYYNEEEYDSLYTTPTLLVPEKDDDDMPF